MAYCNIQDRFLGRKLDSMFDSSNRNKVANLVDSEPFHKWFGEGRRDMEGSPVLDETLSFTNHKGEKRTLFDFDDIAFESFGEVKKLLRATPAIQLWKGELFINNTKRDNLGVLSAKYAEATIDVLNFYYPGMLQVEIYQRKGLGRYSKDIGIPLPVVRVNEEVGLAKQQPMFSYHEIVKPSTDKGRFNQLPAVDELISWKHVLDEFRSYGLSEQDLELLSNQPQVSDPTYQKLLDFVHKINPAFQVETVEGLGANGISYIKDMLIQLEKGQELRAMPEEVAHFFVELLPNDSPLKQDLLKNITNYTIYSLTLQSYKDNPNYQNEQGGVLYEKIKSEAAAKLISEYIYALSSGDQSRVEQLTKTKGGWIRTWWQRFVTMVKRMLKLQEDDALKAYAESALKIINGDIEYLSQQQLADYSSNQVFFQLNDQNKLDMAKSILEPVIAKGKLADLQKVIYKFRKELDDSWRRIVGQDGMKTLEDHLAIRDVEGKKTDINYLQDVHDRMKDLDVSEVEIKDLLTATSEVVNFSEFIDTIVNMERLSLAIYTVVKSYPVTGNHELNITEIQAYRRLYETFRSIITNDLVSVLAGADVEFDVIATLKKTSSTFDVVEEEILKQAKANLMGMLREKLGPQNQIIMTGIVSEIERALLRKIPADKKEDLAFALHQFQQSIQEGMEVEPARKQFVSTMVGRGVPKEKVDLAVLARMYNSLNDLYTPDKAIEDLLSGEGSDIDEISSMSHLMTAAIKNKDVFISNIAHYMVTRRSAADHQANVAYQSYMNVVDPILKKLMQLGVKDEYEAGTRITFIDSVMDKSLGKKRDVVRFLNPHLNSINIERDRLMEERDKTRAAWRKAKRMKSGEEEARKAFVKARRAYIQFNNDFYNSQFGEEMREYQSRWHQDDEFLDIKEEWDSLSQEIRDLRSELDSQHDDATFQLYLEKQKEQKSLLKNGYADGTVKNEEDLRKTEKLKKFFEEGNQFREEDRARTERNFNVARSNYRARLKAAMASFMTQAKNATEENREALQSPEALEKVMQNQLGDPSFRIARKFRYEADHNAEYSRMVHRAKDGTPLIQSDIDADIIIDVLLMGDFDLNNKLNVPNEKYYERMQELFAQIEELSKEGALSPLEEEITKANQALYDILSDRKDFYGQRNPDFMTDEEITQVQGLEGYVDRLRRMNVHIHRISDERKKALTQSDRDAVAKYEELAQQAMDYINGNSQLTGVHFEGLKQELNTLNQTLMQRMLTPLQRKVATEIDKLWNRIVRMSEKQPTNAYWERMEDILPILDVLKQRYIRREQANPKGAKQARANIDNLTILYKKMEEAIFERNHDMLDMLMNDKFYTSERNQVQFLKYFDDDSAGGQSLADDIDADFMAWFDNIAHKQGKQWIPELDEDGIPIPGVGHSEERRFIRRIYYVHSEPNLDNKSFYDEKYAPRYRSTKISEKWYAKPVTWKDSQDMEDWTVSNKTGRKEYLPLSRKQLLAQGKSDKRFHKYLNPEFYTLKDATDEKSKTLMNYLGVTLRTYLQEQDGKPDELKAMYSYPSVGWDHYQSGPFHLQNVQEKTKALWQRLRGTVGKQEETDQEAMMEGVLQGRDFDQTTGEMINAEVVKNKKRKHIKITRPVLGAYYKIPVERTNRNVVAGMLHYIKLSKDFDARADLDPVVSALLDVMRYNEDRLGKDNQRERTKIFDQMYKQMILQEMPDNITNREWFRKMANMMMSLTAFKLTGDLVGGGVNYLQANINNMIESQAQRYITKSDYWVGYKMATVMMGQFWSDYTKKSDLSFWTLMYQGFGFIQGDWFEDQMERTSVKNKTLDWHRTLMYPRKAGELHAQAAMAIGILNFEKIAAPDGSKVPMWQIYDKKDGQLVLKDGFDPAKYNPVDGTEFLRVRNRIHAINLDLHGNYAGINQTEASRHAIGKIAENMKRWFVPGFQRRFGREYFDVSLQQVEEGYYTTGFKFLWDMVRTLATLKTDETADFYAMYMGNSQHKYALRRFSTDMAAALGLWLVTAFAFGYDDDDKDMNKKLRQSSWARNWALIVFLRGFAEHTAYVPFPGFGFTELVRNLLDPFSVAKGAVTNVSATAATLAFTMLYYAGFDNFANEAIYSRNTGADPRLFGMELPMGRKGTLKLWNYLAKSFGYTGSQLDSAFFLKNFQQLQGRLK